jgi:uncharacterized protein YndB with AHSA1/START domain
MVETFVARVSLTINAPRAKVWNALVDPEKIKQYILASDVVRLEHERLLEFDQSRPIFRGSQAVRQSDYHRVTIELSDQGAQTHLSLIEQGNATERELAHSQG